MSPSVCGTLQKGAPDEFLFTLKTLDMVVSFPYGGGPSLRQQSGSVLGP